MAIMVKSVEFIEIAQTGTLSSIDLTKNQNYENCIPFMTLYGGGDYMDNHCMDVYFNGTVVSGVINFQRNETRGSNMNIKCYVVEFDPAEVKVQQGSFSGLPSGATTAYNTPESFTQTKTAMVHYWWSSSGSRRWDIHLVRGRVSSNGTQVDMYRNEAGGTVTGHYFLFEDISTNNDHFIVSHQGATMTGTASDRLMTAGTRDPTRTFLIGSFACSDGGDTYNDRQTARLFIYFKGFARIDRANSSGSIYYQTQMVTFQDETRVYIPFQYYTGFGTTVTTITNSWDRACNVNLSTIVASIPMGISRGSTTSNTENDSIWASMKLTSSTSAEFQRNSVGANSNSYFGYSVIDWGGAIVNTGTNSNPIDPDLSFVKSVENFRMSVTGYQKEQDLSKGQEVSNCIVFAAQRNSSGSSEIRESMHDVWIREPGIVVAHSTDAGGTSIVDVSVVEVYPDQAKVQMGDWVNWGTTTATETLASGVSNTNRAIVVAKWEANEATYWSRVNIRARFIDNETVEFYRNDTGNSIGGTYFILEDLADNFKVLHGLHYTGGTVANRWGNTDYFGYYESIPFCSYATDQDAYYPDRSCCRVYHTGNGGRAICQRNNGTGNMWVSFQWLRFLDEKIHWSPSSASFNTSTTTITSNVNGKLTRNSLHSLSAINPMLMSTGRVDGTGSDDRRSAFHTFRFLSSETEIEISREATVGVNSYSSYCGTADWIGYVHPEADENEELNYAYPTRSLVRSVEKFTYYGGGRLILYYMTKGQVPENCVPFPSWRMAADDGHHTRFSRFVHIDKNLKVSSVSESGDLGEGLDEVLYIVEFDPDQVRVQQLWKTMTGTSVNVTIPQEVDLDRTFMIFSYATDNWSTGWPRTLTTGSFVSSTELNFSRYISDDGIYLSIYLIECLQEQWDVAHFDGGSDSDTNSYDYVSTEYTINRIVQGSYSTDQDAVYSDRNCYRLYPVVNGSYQWNRNNSTGNQTDRHTEQIDFNPKAGIRFGGSYIDMATGTTTENKGTQLSDDLDLDRSIVFPTIVNSMNRVDGTGTNDVGSATVRLELIDGKTFSCTRYDKGITTYGFGQWVEWPEFKKYYFEGVVKERGVPVQRQVACFRADTNERMDYTVSASGTGEYHIETTWSGVHYIVCQDDEPVIDYNHLIWGKMEPYPLPTFSGGEIIYG